MQRFVGSVRRSLSEKNWFAALAMTLTLPDICARVAGFPERGSEARYTRWFDENLLEIYTAELPLLGKTVFLSGKDCYALRCAYLHEGSDEVGAHHRARQALSKYHFRSPDGISMHRNIINGILQLRVTDFCEEFCTAVERWYANLPRTPEVQDRLNALLTVHDGSKSSEEIMVKVATPEESEEYMRARAQRYE